MDGGHVLSGGCRLEVVGWGGGGGRSWRWGWVWEGVGLGLGGGGVGFGRGWGWVWEGVGLGLGGGGGCMEFVQYVSQVLYHVNTGVALHAAL